ncbi:hypothetical protein C7999DRAFT_40842 [Corynascus novoguineensis]|uniref:DUF7357 domain-containing protein n=1 Tax=Corynascus novoguineensis TaxID=1126955 RepID=A0AAN7CV71_9PEZI|nr:hypothetical protein C7999DRAFT_40842 [Corynascus novoguineensis]
MRDANNLRLRLVVQRHALPEVRVVFAVSLDNDPTIANLLEQINEIIPLESSDWGLEDYAVQLRDSSGHGFECLHFQQVSLILKNDEEVFIRPLDIGDRRKRRLTGREQITTDGRHLIDGVAFGRPRLKAPRDRPPVDIPPLKRRRMTYEEDASEDDEPRLLLTEHAEDQQPSSRHVRFRGQSDDLGSGRSSEVEENEDDDFSAQETESTDEGEEDFGSDGEAGSSELEAELRALQADNEGSQDEASDADEDLVDLGKPSAPTRSAGLDLQTLDQISALQTAYPTAQVHECEWLLKQHLGDVKLAYWRLFAKHRPILSQDAMLARLARSSSKAAERANEASDESEGESVASVVKHYDQHGFPSGSVLAGTAAAQMAEAMRKSGHAVKSPVHTSQPSPYSSRHQNEIEHQDEGGTEHGSTSDSGPEVASSKLPMALGDASLFGRAESRGESVSDGENEAEATNSDTGDSDESSDDSSDGSSDDSSDSDDSTDHSENTGGDRRAKHGPDSKSEHDLGSDASSVSSQESDDSTSSSDNDSSDGNVDDALKSHALPRNSDATIQASAPQLVSVRKSQPEGTLQKDDEGSAGPQRPVPPGQGKTATQKRNARRRAARAAKIAAARGEQPPSAGDMDRLSASETQDLVDSVATKKEALLRRLGMVQSASPVFGNGVAGDGAQGAPAPGASASDTPGDATSKPADGGPKRSPPAESSEQVSGTPNGKDDESEAWRSKIVYRAVECCHDEVKLSEPPFPFVQRWDPQQQYHYREKSNRGGRSKRKQRDHSDYQDEDSWSSTKRRKYDGYCNGNDDSYTTYDDTAGLDDTVLNYDEEAEESQKENEELSNPNVEDEDDLPPLPSDISALPILNSGEAHTGMVLTWKQWLLSRATNWQPQISSLTGVVVNVFDTNTIEVRLAKRDRNLDRNEKVYDDEGNRVYDKFELPGMDDEGDTGPEQGYRTLDLADMIEPRILRSVDTARKTAVSDKPSTAAQNRTVAPDYVQSDNLEPATNTASGNPDEAGLERHGVDLRQLETDTQQDNGRSMVSTTATAPEALVSPIPEDRRQEISLLINDAGFRKDVDPSINENPCPDLSSPSRQLEEMAHDATLLHSEASHAQGGNSPRLPFLGTSNNVESQPTVVLEPFHGFSDCTSELTDERPVAYPKLHPHPSETGSLPSGRQPDRDLSIELGNDPIHDLDDPAVVSRSRLGRHSDDDNGLANRECEDDVGENSDSGSSDSSFPSLSDMWISHPTSNSKIPTKHGAVPTIKAKKSEVMPDLEYEEAMRRIDDADLSDDGNLEHTSKLAQGLLDEPIGKPTPKKPDELKEESSASPAPLVKTEQPSPRPTRISRASYSRTERESNSQVPPEGSQVVSLLSSSSEPELEERYAEDSIDETYEEPSMPTGSGWVRKARARRGMSVPASSAAQDVASKRLTSQQSQQTTDKRTTAALNSLLRAKKRVLGRSMF